MIASGREGPEGLLPDKAGRDDQHEGVRSLEDWPTGRGIRGAGSKEGGGRAGLVAHRPLPVGLGWWGGGGVYPFQASGLRGNYPWTCIDETVATRHF